MERFRALLLQETAGKVTAGLDSLPLDRLPPGDVLIDVRYSTLNYKDALILTGQGRLVRTYPHIPGIDFSGVVMDSADPRFSKGDPVILTGWRVGEAHWGGYAMRARVKADWLVPLPAGLTLADAMAIGTAGFTAMLAVMALETHGLIAGEDEVLVTGASGGVGSMAVALLAALGHRVTASTGRLSNRPWLEALGATSIIDRADIAHRPEKPLLRERWRFAIDAVGGDTLAAILASLSHRGAVAACGLAGGAALHTSVIPFLLRGIALIGIDSTQSPAPERIAAWHRLAGGFPLAKLKSMTEWVGLADLPGLAPRILAGEIRGRVGVDLSRS